jgi:hypothetical protein
MRFSLKWALAATAYVALAAASFARPSDWFTVTLWALAFLAFCYATLAAIVDEGNQRATAAGFALGWCLCVAFTYAAPYRAPWNLLLANPNQLTVNSPAPIQRLRARIDEAYSVQSDPDPFAPAGQRLSQLGRSNPSARYVERVEEYNLALCVQSANAIAAMAAGLIGALLGTLAFRQAVVPTDRATLAGVNRGTER